MEGQTCFRRARLDRGLTVEDVARLTHLRPAHVALIDAGRLAELPAGLYARAYVRAYATAVGLDPEAVIARFADELPCAPDPIPALRDVARERVPPTIGTLVLDWIRSAMAERARPGLVGAPPGESPGIRAAAACIDAALLAVINLSVALLIAASCGVSLDVLLRQAGAAVAVVWTFTSTTYFVLLAGIGGRTAGAHVCSLVPEPGGPPLSLRCILLRAARTAMGEASIVLNWTMKKGPDPIFAFFVGQGTSVSDLRKT